MEKAGLTNAHGWKILLTLKPCPVSVDVFNEKLIPAQYLRTKEVTAPDKAAIKTAIEKEKLTVPGARIVQNISLVRK